MAAPQTTAGQGQFFTLTLIFKDHDSGEIRRYTLQNVKGYQVKKIRADIFLEGFLIKNEDYPGTEFEIISPWAILKFYVSMQEKKFDL